MRNRDPRVRYAALALPVLVLSAAAGLTASTRQVSVESLVYDLKSPDGFENDAQVANIVLEALGRPELRVELQTSPVS